MVTHPLDQALKNFDSVGALLAGQRGPIHYRYRLHASDNTGAKGRRVMDVTGGAVSLSNFRDHTWELTLDRREMPEGAIESMGNWVRLYAQVRKAEDPEEGNQLSWLEFPLGHFTVDPANPSHQQEGTTYAISARSGEVVVLDDFAWKGYKAAKGRGVLSIAREILISRGVPEERVNFPGGDKNLNTDMWFDAHQDFSKCSYLRIINAVLNAGGFYALYTDAEGYYRTHGIQEAGSAPVAVTYQSEGARRMVVGEVDEEYDLERFANRVVVYSGDPAKGAMIEASATNEDPDSPGSILPPPAGIGRVVMKDPIVLQNLISATEAKDVARAQLKRSTALNHKAQIRTLPDPRRGPREDYELDVRRQTYPDPDAFGPAEGQPGASVISGRWTVSGWTLPLASPPQPMEHELSRAERLLVG